MAANRSALIILHGGCGASGPERLVAGVRIAVARQLAAHARSAGIAEVIIATDEPGAFDGLDATVDPDPPGAFAFDERISGLIERYELDAVAVTGSGALALATADTLRPIADWLNGNSEGVLTNNFFSADLSAWRPAVAIGRISSIQRDNALPRRLRDDAGLAVSVLPRSLALQFDVDTPSDVAVISLSRGLEPALTASCEPAAALAQRYRQILPLICDRDAEIVVAGRVGSATWQHLERETACRVRMFAEERGMAAAGPGHRARSAMGFLLEAVGFGGFFERMAELGDALVLDARVLEAHFGIAPTREDRFRSDLFDADGITNAWLRDFTLAAANAPVPVLLGGHSLVTGGLMALGDVAWAEHDERGAAKMSPVSALL